MLRRISSLAAALAIGAGLLVAPVLDLPAQAATRKVVAVAAGGAHSCAITPSGKVKCWGYNAYGQLGDNTTTSRLTPVSVYALSGKAKQVGVGYSFTCILTTKGTVWCWGDNGYGQLGNGTTTSSTIPVKVPGLSGIASLSVGGLSACALTKSHTVKCWGYNSSGQVGTGSVSASVSRPTTVVGLSKKVSGISMGYYHACAVTTKGAAKCWGNNAYGQLGDNSTTNRLTPVTVQGLGSKVTRIVTGSVHTCAVRKGAVSCWGYGLVGNLGNGGTANSSVPVKVAGLSSKVASLSSAAYTTCAIRKNVPKCWGYNAYGTIGDNSVTNRPKPVAVYGLDKVRSISGNPLSQHLCAVTWSYKAKCWGDNAYGQLGNSTTTGSPKPVSVSGLS